MNVISVNHLSFAYENSEHKAVDDVSFNIEEGSYNAIVGANGSGKSTLARLICNLEQLQSGTIETDKNKTIGLIFQSPKDQIVSSIVYRDTAFGPKNLNLSKGEVELRTIECLNFLELLDKAQKSSSSLSLGQTQKLAAAGMLAVWPQILILDESISMLDPDSRKTIYEFLRFWHKKNNTIIHITHDKEAVKEAENVICMEKGKIVFSGNRTSFFKQISLCQKLFNQKINELAGGKKAGGETVLEFKNVSFNYEKNDKKSGINDISFELRKGTLTAISGPSGSGKSTVLELGSGLLKPDFGEILCTDNPSFCQQNASNSLFESFACDDVAFGPKNAGVEGSRLKIKVQQAMDMVNLPYEVFAERQSMKLSGGEQRRLAIAGIIALDKDIIFFDEPTAGLDGESRYIVLKLLKQLTEEGKTVLFSTHKNDEILLADSHIKIKDGKIISQTFSESDGKEVGKAPDSRGFVSRLKLLEPSSSVNTLASLRKILISLSGQNKKKVSVIEKMHPALRILLFLSLFVISLVFRNLWQCALMMGVTFIYCLLCGYSIKKYIVSLLKIFPFLIFFSIFQFIFLRTDLNSKIIYCLTTLLRTNAAIGCIAGFFVSISESDLLDGLSVLLKPLSLIKIPVRYFILMLEIIFRFIPLLVEEAISIIKTQIIRGGLGKAKGFIAKVRNIIPLIVPLVIQTIKRSMSLADAITMRCFK
ncbi:MAG: ATP-binding cassette domain-containing protein [Treponema sp.]|nr:ATP-binding cassette domain-containing protein [Treponema sp.]